MEPIMWSRSSHLGDEWELKEHWSWASWLTPVILATREAEIGKITV
jgi:hypothetical protein